MARGNHRLAVKDLVFAHSLYAHRSLWGVLKTRINRTAAVAVVLRLAVCPTSVITVLPLHPSLVDPLVLGGDRY